VFCQYYRRHSSQSTDKAGSQQVDKREREKERASEKEFPSWLPPRGFVLFAKVEQKRERKKEGRKKIKNSYYEYFARRSMR
jgi:hypothetical protein